MAKENPRGRLRRNLAHRNAVRFIPLYNTRLGTTLSTNIVACVLGTFCRTLCQPRLLLLIFTALLFSACGQSWGKLWDVAATKRATVDVCTLTASYSEVIRTDFGEDLLFHLRAQRDKGNTGIAGADIASITGIANSLKWAGGVLAPNGKIYAIPRQSDIVAIINPTTNTIDLSSITGLTTTANKWVGGVLAPNGKIYAIPSDATSVLIIDPATDTADTTTISGLSAATGKWSGGVLAPNGKIYSIPGSADHVLIIDPTTNTVDTTTITGLGATTVKWLGGVLAPNGKIYGMPHNIAIGNLLIIDPETNTADIASVGGLAGGTDKWFGGVLAPNNKIYGIPFDSPIGLIVNTNSNGSFCDAVLHSAYLNKY